MDPIGSYLVFHTQPNQSASYISISTHGVTLSYLLNFGTVLIAKMQLDIYFIIIIILHTYLDLTPSVHKT